MLREIMIGKFMHILICKSTVCYYPRIVGRWSSSSLSCTCNSVLSRSIRQRDYYTLWLLSAAAEGRWVIVRHGARSGNGWYFYLPTDSYHFPFQNRNTIILKHPNIISCWALSPDSRALSPSSRPLSHIKYQNIKVHYQGFLEHPKFQESDQ